MAVEPIVANHYALLIGINSYPERPLKGCVQDVSEIEQYLQQTISPLSIQKLIAPRHLCLDTSRSCKSEEARPTYRNVTTALRNINAQAKAGDYVYIHFSGHGTKTEPDDEYSSRSTGDLALVLLDEDEEAVSCLSGPKLARYFLNPMVQKGLVITLVLDCCFAASVYRQDGDATRFLPCKTDTIMFRRHDLELEKGREVSAATRDMRDASMQLNWLMDADKYAILTACGAKQEAGEITTDDGVTYGKLSYSLLQSFSHSSGCKKTHGAIYRYLCAMFQGYTRRQSPVLYGRKDQGFFGAVDTESCKSFQVFQNQAGELQLPAGRAHGFCKGDLFVLHPLTYDSVPGPKLELGRSGVNAEIAYLGNLNSILETTDVMTKTRHGMWTASVLRQSGLRRYSILLHHDLPNRIELKAELAERFLAVEDGNPLPRVFYITASRDQDLEVYDRQDRLLANITYTQAAEQIEHLVRFALIKDLTNKNADGDFQKCFDIYIQSGGKRFDSGCTIAMKHGEKLELVLENLGCTTLFFYLYNMGSSWQIQNLLRASHLEIPAPEGAHPGRRSKKIRMEVPDAMKEKGLRSCEDYIKIFATSQPSLFDSLELPKLGQAVAKVSETRSSAPQADLVREHLEPWASADFHIFVSM